MTVFFTSDLHLGHRGILQHCPETRPFSSVEEMDEAIIAAHNKVVKQNDTVFILGDVIFFPPHQSDSANEIQMRKISRLNGKKILIIGNHDRKHMKNNAFTSNFVDTHIDFLFKYYERVAHLYHYPIDEWDGYFRGTWHLHGHIHNQSAIRRDQRLNVAIDAWPSRKLMPWSFDEVEDFMKNQPLKKS